VQTYVRPGASTGIESKDLVEYYPVCEQLTRENSVDARFRPLRRCKAFHKLQARSFGHGIWQATAALRYALDVKEQGLALKRVSVGV